MAIEEAKYSVIEKEGAFEIRKYFDHIVAETYVDSSFKDAGNIAFRRIFKYIDGNNTTNSTIAMTAPVSQQKKSEKISMTAPVNMQNLSGTYRISFLMPSKYTMETIPRPLDERVKVKEEQGKTFAAYKYSGGWSEKKYEKMKKKLLEIIAEKKLKVRGEPIFARYNSPFMPWLFRRNEILIEILYN
ncbi:MAG: heme-binding protein [Deltaproteobacteria bacterium]|nr:heme-binding protein [Deltaproteobacteria bacterium]